MELPTLSEAKPETGVNGAGSSATSLRPPGVYYYSAPRIYLRSMLAVAGTPRVDEYLLLLLPSGRFIRTDRLGALVARALVDGRSGAEAMHLADQVEPGAGERARLLISILGAKGAMTLWSRPVSSPRWRIRRLVSLAMGRVLHLLLLGVHLMPTAALVWMFRFLPRSPIGHRAWRSSGPTILHNLRTSGYGDRSEGWLEDVGRRVVESSTNSLFNFLTLALPAERLTRLVERLFDFRAVDRLADQVQVSGPAIGVFLHGTLSMAVPNSLRARNQQTVRAVVSWQHGMNVSERSGPLAFFLGDPPEMAVDVANPLDTALLLRHLKAGRCVFLGLDTWGRSTTGKVELLGHTVPRNDGPAWLAVRSGRPLALWTTHPSRSGVVVTASPLVYPDPSLPVAARVEDVSIRLYGYAEAAIREHPEGWMGWRIAPWESDNSDGYNYSSFSFEHEDPELERWLEFGPHPGEPAPDFQLDDLDGNPVRLRDLRGRPVVLEFGSYSCAIFADSVADMERLSREHPEAVFLVIAVREAHPGTLAPAHTTMAEKRLAARRLAAVDRLGRRVLVDDLEGTVHMEYGGAWNPVYVIDDSGRVAYRTAWSHPAEVAHVLEALADGGSPDPGESVVIPRLASRAPIGQRVLERGGESALVDLYRTGTPYLRRVLRESPSEAIREALRTVMR